VKWYKKVNTDAKAAYLLALSEKILYNISDCEWFQEAREAMDMCWEWVEEKKHTSLGLYETLDRDGEDGENGLFLFEAIYGEIVHDAQTGLVCFSVLDAICYTTWRAFLYERKKRLPQTLESENDETIDQFTDKVMKINGYQEQWAERLQQYLLQNHPSGSNNKIQREEIMRQI
jgi:hypothetical protein